MAIKIFLIGHARSVMSHDLYVASSCQDHQIMIQQNLPPSKSLLDCSMMYNSENIEDAYSIPLQFKREAIILEAHLIFPFWGCITPWAHRWWRRWKRAGSSLKPGSATSHKCKCYDLNSTTVNPQALCNSGHWQMQTNLTQLKMEINNI